MAPPGLPGTRCFTVGRDPNTSPMTRTATTGIPRSSPSTISVEFIGNRALIIAVLIAVELSKFPSQIGPYI